VSKTEPFAELARELLEKQVEDDPQTCCCDNHVEKARSIIADWMASRVSQAARQIVRGESPMWPTIGEFNRGFEPRVKEVERLLRSILGGSHV